MTVLGFLPKLKVRLRLAFGADFLHDFYKNVIFLILYQHAKFQFHIPFPSQHIKKMCY